MEKYLFLTTTDLKGIARHTSKLWNYITRQQFWDIVITASFKILMILIFSYLAVVIGKKVIARAFIIRIHNNERRQITIVKLLQSVLSYL
ncbi:MAG: hypothetical protein RR642_12770, partial [Solibacillus sp.]